MAKRSKSETSAADKAREKTNEFFQEYDNQTIGQILAVAVRGDDEMRNRIVEKERAGKSRAEVILPLVGWNS